MSYTTGSHEPTVQELTLHVLLLIVSTTVFMFTYILPAQSRRCICTTYQEILKDTCSACVHAQEKKFPCTPAVCCVLFTVYLLHLCTCVPVYIFIMRSTTAFFPHPATLRSMFPTPPLPHFPPSFPHCLHTTNH